MRGKLSQLLVLLLLACAVLDFLQFDTLNPEAPMNEVTLISSRSTLGFSAHATIPQLPDDSCLFCAAALIGVGPSITVALTAANVTLLSSIEAALRSPFVPERPPRSFTLS